MLLNYKTRGMSDPKGKPKVYFSCHPEDFAEAFPLVTEDLLNHANCSVWFDADMDETSSEELEDILKEMQLVVFAVTSKFIHENNRAKDLELPLALKNHIPVLPVMLENGLGYEFSNNCAKIQVVPKYGTDPTAIPYDEVLQTFLDSVLVGDELADKVRDAFDAYVFLSYRKKDRKHAQRLMRLIHENPQFRDIAIWYDEFLVPGEGFNEAIKDAFQKSTLFAMAVTPHLEEAGNYVMRVEYPMARDRRSENSGFEIVPVEMYEPEDGEEGKDWRIDQSRLKGQKDFRYQEITDLQDEHRKQEMQQSFLDALTRIAKKNNDGSAQHRFFIGLAYLNGIDVEINQERALGLIRSAAEDPDPCTEATAKLADMYLNGEGVERDPKQAVFWQEKLADQFKAAYDECHDPDEHKGYGTAYFKALRKLSDMYRDSGNTEAAVSTSGKALSFSDELEQEVGIREQRRDKALILNQLGSLYRETGDLAAAQDCFTKACSIYEKQAYEIGTGRARRDLSISYERLGDICRKKNDLAGAELYYQKTREIREQLLQANASAERRRDYSAVLTKLGNVRRSAKQYDEATDYYRKALSLDKILAEEVKSPQAWDDYGVSLVKMGDVYRAENRIDDAADCYEKACAVFRKNAEETGSLFFRGHLTDGYGKLAGLKKDPEEKQEEEAVSITVTKGSVWEEMSLVRASLEDAESRLTDGIKPDAISNEKIRKGDEILETYRVTSDAIHGGMGSVWQVHHRYWDVDLAMKRPQPEFFAEGSRSRKEEFVAECENWINMGLHPCIVSCYYVRDISGVPSIFSEWMCNGSLKDRIRDGSLYEGTEQEITERILNIAVRTAEGLKYSHDKGLIHQDVKPGNILLTEGWDAKVADFGLAKAQSRLTNDGKPVSTGHTLQYCPEEQTKGAEAEAWMDVYAWALTVLEMYVGRRLWKTGAEAAVSPEQYFVTGKVKIPEGMKQLIKACLRTGTAERLSGFDRVLPALTEIWKEETGKPLSETNDAETELVSSANLNNYALSMIDMGKEDQAGQLFEESLRAMPDNLFARINSVFFRRQRGEISYREALEYFQNLPDSEEKINAIRTLIAQNSGLMEIRILRECSYPDKGCFDADGRVWVISERSTIGYGELFCFDADTGERLYDDTKLGSGYCQLTMDNDKHYLYAARRRIKLYGYRYADYITRFDMHDVSEGEDIHFSGEDQESFLEYRNKYIKYGAAESGRCLSLWFEGDDILCSLERLTWITQEEDTFDTYSLVRFRLQEHDTAELIERIHLGDTVPSEGTDLYERYLKNKPVEGIFREDALGVNDEGSRALLRAPIGIHRDEEQHSPALYKVQAGAARFVYHLEKFSDVDEVIEHTSLTQEVEKEFDCAVENGDYPEAIRLFESYRDLPEQRDSDTTQRMEKLLAKVCRRTSLHHCIEVTDYKFNGDKPPFYKRVSMKHYEKNPASGQSGQLYKAMQRMVRKFPVRIDYRSGQRFVDKSCLSIEAFCLETDEKNAFIEFYKHGIAKLTLSDGSLQGIAIYPYIGFRTIGDIVVSPDANMFAVHCHYGGMVYMVFGKGHEKGINLAGQDAGDPSAKRPTMTDGCFTPDSNLFLWRSYDEEKYYMSSLDSGAEKVEAFEARQLSADSNFSADSFFLELIDKETREPLKCFRLSYNYTFDGFKESIPEAEIFLRQYLHEHDGQVAEDLGDIMQELSYRGYGCFEEEGVRKALTELSGAPEKTNDTGKKGLFSRLFG